MTSRQIDYKAGFLVQEHLKVVDPRAMGSPAAGTPLPLLPGQARHQVVQPVVHRPPGDHCVVAGGGHDVKDVGPLEFVAPTLAAAVAGIRAHSAERNPVADGAADHRPCELDLGGELDVGDELLGD